MMKPVTKCDVSVILLAYTTVVNDLSRFNILTACILIICLILALHVFLF